MKEPTFDKNGYPTDKTLEEIANYKAKGYGQYNELMEYIKDCWWHPEMMKKKEKLATSDIWHISTGGWSGNEDIIEAMKKNFWFWMACWVQSRRGGHYIFEVKKDENG